MVKKRVYASESVTEGHPDKVCDQISDAVLDAVYELNPGDDGERARVALETAVKTRDVILLGEITCANHPDYEAVALQVIRDIGYDCQDTGIDPETCRFTNLIEPQSPHIAQGTSEENLGAGDQGMMFGFAARETHTLMPLPIHLAHELTRGLANARKSGALPYLRPDGKAQVTVEYEDLTPIRVQRVVVATQHTEDVEHGTVSDGVLEEVIKPVLRDWWREDIPVTVNGTGKFVIGGPAGDAGLTGRKIIVDTYGGLGRHGGGAFSGKDPTKVDRSAAYYARYVAKNVVAAGLAEVCEFHLAYAIGVPEPQAMGIELFGTGQVDEERLVAAIDQIFDFTPSGIIRELDLRRPIYKPTAAYGHFGRTDIDLPWEQTDRVEALREAVGL